MCDCTNKNKSASAGSGDPAPDRLPPNSNSSNSGGGGNGNASAPQAPLPGAGEQGAGDAGPMNSAQSSAQSGAGDAVGAWNNGKKLNALWSINQTRNAWVGVNGIGWKKLSNVNDSGIVALNMIGSVGRAVNANVDYRDEADGMIHELYVW